MQERPLFKLALENFEHCAIEMSNVYLNLIVKRVRKHTVSRPNAGRYFQKLLRLEIRKYEKVNTAQKKRKGY
jgi:hypothetical protein